MANSKVFREGCVWELTLNNEMKEYASDQELDAALKTQQRKLFEELNIPLHVLFSLNAQEQTNNIIEHIQQDFKTGAVEVTDTDDLDAGETYCYIPGTIGTTRFLTTFGTNSVPFVRPFNLEMWKVERLRKLTDPNEKCLDNEGNLLPNLTSEEAEKEIEAEIKSWKKLTEIGTAVHKILEQTIKEEEITWNKELFTEDVFKNIKTQAQTFINEIKTQYPDCTIYSELAIKSKNISQEWMSRLQANGFDGITGIVDFLVIDKSGRAHLYDFKVSRKAIGSERNSISTNWDESENAALQHYWHTTKKLSASLQLAIYKKILEQYGIKVVDSNIVPIKLNLEYDTNKVDIKQVESVTIPHTGNIVTKVENYDKWYTRYKGDVDNIFNIPANITGEECVRLSDIMKVFIPKNPIVDRNNAKNSIESLKKGIGGVVVKLGISDSHYQKNGAKYKFIPKNVKGMKTEYVSEEKLDELLEKYIAKKQGVISDLTESIFSEIQTAQASSEYSIEESFLTMFPEQSRPFIKVQFERYFHDGWTIEGDEDTIKNGILVFKKGKYAEVISLNDNDLYTKLNIGVGTSILGKTTKDMYIDNNMVLTANCGNIEAMRIMTYIALKPEVFGNCKITEVRVVNPYYRQETSVENSRLIYNYNELCKKNKSANAPKIKTNLFLADAEAAIEGALDRAMCAGYGLDGLIKKGESYYTERWIISAMNRLKNAAGLYITENGTAHYTGTQAWDAYKKLSDAYNFLRGYHTTIETDQKNILGSNKPWDLNGLKITSPQFASSANIRQLGSAIDQFSREVHKDVFITGQKMQQLFKDIYKKYGTGSKVFNSWFERNGSELDNRFILKDYNSHEFDGDPTTRVAIKEFCDVLARLKHPEYSEVQIQQWIEENPIEYREVPLLEAAASRQLKRLGLIQMARNKWKELSNLTQGVFMDENIDMSQYVGDAKKLYNKFNLTSEQRRERIDNDNGGIDLFETDLELVFNAALVAYTKENLSRKYIPIIAGLKLGLDYMDNYRNDETRLKHLRETFDKIVRSKFYGENVVEEGRDLLKFLNVVKAVFTKMSLSLNSVSFLRESLQGIYTGVSRSFVEQLPGVNKETYTKAVIKVIQESPKTFSGVSLLQQLNMYYGMANMSMSQLANGRRLNWASINHWGSDTLFITATSPDFLHRMSILVAKMMGDGCWEAHTLNKDGILEYDFKKDGRFQHFINDDFTHKDYLKEKSLYLSMIEEFNKAGFVKTDGSKLNPDVKDNLPQAYVPKEAQTIKNWADLLYGHYDEESKSLLYDTFFGAIFLQFKTYLTAKLEQWTMHGGIYNTHMLVQKFDEDGKPIYQKFYEDEDGNAHRDFISEDEYNELSTEEKAMCTLYFDYEGMPMEGMLEESVKFVGALFHITDEDWKEIWNDPKKRAILKLAFHDMFIMMLLVALCNWIFGNIEDIDKPIVNSGKVLSAVRKAGPIENMAYNIITGSAADSQLPNILQSFTDRPPSLVAAQRFGKSSWGLITGDSSLAYWATQNFGMIRQFQGIAAQLNPEQE